MFCHFKSVGAGVVNIHSYSDRLDSKADIVSHRLRMCISSIAVEIFQWVMVIVYFYGTQIQ